MKPIVVVLLVATLCGCVYTDRTSYSGYQVFDIFPSTDCQFQAILSLQSDHVELDFWSDGAVGGRPMTVMTPPLLIDRLTHILTVLDVQYQVVIPDVGQAVEDEQLGLCAHPPCTYNPNNFNSLALIEGRLEKYLADCPACFSCEVVDIGRTFEGRKIKRFSIYKACGYGRRAYWIDSNIHAREWLSSATNLRLIDNFVYNYDTDPEVARLLDTYDWHFVPIMNPDGFVYSWTDDRLWRKSRTVHSTSACKGVDLNRNYDVLWGQSGTGLEDPCSETFAGESPASCIETQDLQAEIDRLTPSLDAFLTVHTYGRYILHPLGHEIAGVCATAPDDYDLFGAATDMANAIEQTSGSSWNVGNSCEVLYATSGTTQDYAYRSGAGVKYSYTPELRGTGFIIDPVNIQPSFEEMWAALVALEHYITHPELGFAPP